MKRIVFCLLFTMCVGMVTTPVLAGSKGLGEALGHYYRGDHRAAVEALKELIHEEPDNAAAYYYLGYTYQEMGMYTAARAAFKRTYEINPDFVPAVSVNPRPE